MEKRPLHIALIPNGTRRWADSNNVPTLIAYRMAAEHLCKFAIDWCFLKWHIKYVTIFGMSMENYLKRSTKWKSEIYQTTKWLSKRLISDPRVHCNRIHVQMLGRRDSVPKDVLKDIVLVEEETKTYGDYYLTFLFLYSGREEIIQMVRSIADALLKGTLKGDIDKTTVEKYLLTSSLPDLDLLVRPGENRVSNFMLWRLAYSEMYFLEKPFLDLTESDLVNILEDFSKTDRRFGR